MTADLRPASGAGASQRRRRRSQSQVQASTENRSAIVRSALATFALHGYTKTTLQAVAEQVGLTRTGLLHHFRSKEELFIEVIEEGRRWAEQQSNPSSTGRGLDGIRQMRSVLGSSDDAVYVRFVQTLQGEALHEDAPEHVVIYVRMRLAQIRGHVASRLEEARENGEIGDIDVSGVATMIAGTITGLQGQWLLDESIDTGAALDGLLVLLASTAPNSRRAR